MNGTKTLSENDELSFMNDLLAGIDGSFFDATPSPATTPRKVFNKPTPQSIAKQTGPEHPGNVAEKLNDHDLDALLEGAGEWDWDDMEKDVKATSSSELLDDFRCVVDEISVLDGQKVSYFKLDMGRLAHFINVRSSVCQVKTVLSTKQLPCLMIGLTQMSVQVRRIALYS